MSTDTGGRPMEILLIEDNLADARLAIEALKIGRVKHRLTLVRNGIEAMEFLNQQGRFARAPRPDLILLDLELPLKDGRDVLIEVKADLDMSSIPVVILTASQDHEDRLRSQLLNVDGYMTKPVDIAKFLTLVRDLKRFWMSDVALPLVG